MWLNATLPILKGTLVLMIGANETGVDALLPSRLSRKTSEEETCWRRAG